MVSSGKWTKYQYMMENDKLSSYLPHTLLLSKKNLFYFLTLYEKLIMKPCMGRLGYGVIQIHKFDDNHFEIHEEYHKKYIEGKTELFLFLRERQRKKGYQILQQKLDLANYYGTPFDIRVIIQRKISDGKWKVTGRVAKVAAKKYIITNVTEKLLPVEEAINRSFKLDNESIQKLILKMDEVSLLTVNTLKRYYPERRMLGIDIAIDQNKRIWVLEANLLPSINLFKHFDDKRMWEEIKKYL